MDDATLDLAVEGALFSGFGTAGQRCTSLGTVIVHESVHDEFLRRFTAATEAAAVGDPFADVLYGPMIHERFLERFGDWLGLVRDHHAVSGSTGTGRITADNPRAGFVGDPDGGLFCHPTIVDGVTPRRRDLRHRDVRPDRRRRQLRRLRRGDRARQRPRLRAVVGDLHQRPQARARFRERVSAGMVSVNNSTSGAEAHLPFGGNGKSGNGSRQSGIWVLDQFTRWQSLNWDYAGKLQKAQMDVVEVAGDPGYRLDWD